MRFFALLLATAMAVGTLARAGDALDLQAPLSVKPGFLSPAATLPNAVTTEPLSMGPQHHFLIDGEDSLDRLKADNPRHYAIAQRILADATQICGRTEAGPIPTKYGAQNVECMRGMWLTSNPPKRSLFFTIDDTGYSARIAIPNPDAKVQQAR